MFRKTWLALCAGGLILMLMVSFSGQQSAPAHVTRQECQVYHALYASSDHQELFYFGPNTRNFHPFDRLGEEIEAPSSFTRETGEYEEIELEIEGKTFQRPVTERFKTDTSGYFDPVRDVGEYSIVDCFETLERPPRFFSGQFQELLDTKGNPTGDGMVTDVTLAHVSRVGFSDDEKFALIYTEHHCGGLCGAGAFVLLERIEEQWEIAGSAMRWIS